jgi:hypothetical protein
MQIQVKMLWAVAVAACSCAASFAGSIGYSNAGNIAPAYTFTAATSGDEIAYFYSSTAAYVNEIGLWANGVQLGGYGLNNHSSSFGQSVDFGHVDAGDVIVFSLDVFTRGYIVNSDPAMNPDQANHVYTTPFVGATRKGVTITAGTLVAFEDLLLPHSNLNYDDEDVVFSNLTATAVSPEPVSLFLLGIGIAGIGLRTWTQSLKGV